MSVDPFHQLIAQGGKPPALSHAERAHSKFSASASERWMKCPGSVRLCETVPSRTSKWAEEGTQAHEVLEKMLKAVMVEKTDLFAVEAPNQEMWEHGRKAVAWIRKLFGQHLGADFLLETRVYLDFIHPEMFGTFDSSVIEHFGTLHVIDYKYGAGVPVSPVKNLQMIFYGIGLAARYRWNFKTVRLWIYQPRIKGFEGPLYWDVSIAELKKIWVPLYVEGIKRVEKFPEKYVEGGWCHWCNAKGVCPLKSDKKNQQAALVFGGKLV